MAANVPESTNEVLLLFPTPVWAGSGSKGKISACMIQTPLKFSVVKI